MRFVERSTGFMAPQPLGFSEPTDRPISETFRDAFRLENSVVSLMHAMDDRGEYDPEFSVMDHITDENREYGTVLARAKNLDDFNNRWNRIQEELEAKRRMDSDGALGFFAYMAAGVLDPINLLPIGGIAHRAYKGGNLLRGLVMGAEAGLVGAGAAEVALQGSQLARTAGESALNVAAGVFLGGVIGTGLGAVRSGLETRGVRQYSEVMENVADEMEVATGERPAAFGTSTGSVGAKSPSDLPTEKLQEITEKVNKTIDADIEAGKLAPEEAADETLRRMNDYYKEAFKELAGFKQTIPLNVVLKGVPGLKHVTPTLRSFMQESGVGREIAGQLMETGMSRAQSEYTEGAVDVPVEALIKLWEGKKYRARKDVHDAYHKYRTGEDRETSVGTAMMDRLKAKVEGRNMTHEERMANGLLSNKEFGDEVAFAMRNGDVHEIPEVEALAKKLRKEIYDPIKDMAIEVGYLPEDVAVNPETAQSYLNRIWDVRAIEKRTDLFKQMLIRDLSVQAAEAKARLDVFGEKRAKLVDSLRQLRAKRKDIKTAVREGMEKQTKKSAQKITEEAMESIDVDAVMPDGNEIANAAARRAFNRTLRKELTETVEESVAAEIEAMTEELLENAIAKAVDPEEAAVLATLREEISEPLAAKTGEVALDDLIDPAVYKAAEEEAALAASKAHERSLNMFEKKMAKWAEDPDLATEAGRKRVLAKAKKEAAQIARKEANAVLKEATEDVDDAIRKATDDVKALEKERARDQYFVEMMDPLNADMYVQDIINRILATGGVRPPHDLDIGKRVGGVAGPSNFKARSLIVKDNDYADFLVNDPDELITKLIDHTAPRLELRRKFGSDVFRETEAFRKLDEDWSRIQREQGILDEEMSEKQRGKLWSALHDNKERSISDIEGVFERLKGTYKMPENPNAALNRVSMGLRQTNFVRMMGGVVLSSVPDLARPLMTHGILRSFRSALLPMLTDFNTVKLRSRDLHRLNIITDMVDNTRAQRIADITDPNPRRSLVEAGIGTMSDSFGYMSGIAKWNDMLKTYAAMVSHDRITDLIEKWVKIMEGGRGKLTKAEITFLKDNYIDAGTARDIWAQFQAHGEKHSDGFWLSNIDNWEDLAASNRFRAAMSREVDRTIVTPGQDRPLMASTPLGKLIFQFKSFQLAAMERMLLAGLQQNDIHFYMGVVSAVGMGSLAYIAKEKVAKKEPSMEPGKLITEGIDRSGVMGWLMEPNNFLEKATNGHIGLGPLVNGESLSRYRSRNEFGAALGPSFGTVQQLIGLMGYAADFAAEGKVPNERQQESMMRLLPYSNLFYLRMLMEATSDD